MVRLIGALVGVTAVLLVAVACGGGDDGAASDPPLSAAAEPAPEPAPKPAPESAPEPSPSELESGDEQSGLEPYASLRASSMPAAELTAAGCTPLEAVPAAGWDHFEEIPEGYEFGTFPRTADIHHPALLIWNLYTRPVDQMMIGHNLEHGGIYVQYAADVPQETVAQIADWWDADPNGIIVAPLPELPSQTIALGAWYAPVQSSDQGRVYEASSGQLAYCVRFDERAFTAFKDAFRGKGPEPIPVEYNSPGT